MLQFIHLVRRSGTFSFVYLFFFFRKFILAKKLVKKMGSDETKKSQNHQ
jgi:hypothetical protein